MFRYRVNASKFCIIKRFGAAPSSEITAAPRLQMKIQFPHQTQTLLPASNLRDPVFTTKYMVAPSKSAITILQILLKIRHWHKIL